MSQYSRRQLRIRAKLVAWIVSLLILMSPTGSAFGQSDRGAALGWICVSSIANECFRIAFICDTPLFVPLTYYVVADIDFADAGAPEQNALNGIQAWEGRIELSPDLILTGAQFEGTNGGASDADFLVDIGLPGILADSMPRTIVTLNVIATSASLSTRIDLLPSTNPLAIGVVGWREALDTNGCTSPETGAAVACFHPFEVVDPLRFHYRGAAEAGTWTSVKQVFR